MWCSRDNNYHQSHPNTSAYCSRCIAFGGGLIPRPKPVLPVQNRIKMGKPVILAKIMKIAKTGENYWELFFKPWQLFKNVTCKWKLGRVDCGTISQIVISVWLKSCEHNSCFKRCIFVRLFDIEIFKDETMTHYQLIQTRMIIVSNEMAGTIIK